MSDLVSGLLAAIEQREKLARAATPGPWRHDPGKHWRKPGSVQFEEAVFCGPPGPEALCVAGTGPTDDFQSMADADHIAMQDPEAVLRLCRAHREIIQWFINARDNEARRYEPALHLGYHLFRQVVEALAEGYGITEEG